MPVSTSRRYCFRKCVCKVTTKSEKRKAISEKLFVSVPVFSLFLSFLAQTGIVFVTQRHSPRLERTTSSLRFAFFRFEGEQVSRGADKNYFRGLEIYFKALEIYFSALEIDFSGLEKVSSCAAKNFVAGRNEVPGEPFPEIWQNNSGCFACFWRKKSIFVQQ